MRASSLLVSSSLLALACAEPASEPAPRSKAGEDAPTMAQAEPQPEVSSPAIPSPTIAEPEPAPPTVDPSIELPPAEAEPPELDPADPLAPILPSGPEPGSPEADAELADLLEESTLTQDEFDAAFRKNKPQIAGDQFVFGPGDRTRKRPVVEIGTPKIEGSKIAGKEISELASGHLRGFEGCLAVALTDDPDIRGSVTLRVHFNQKGEVDDAKAEAKGGAAGASLRECLAAVADNWSLAGAAGATVELLLSLRSE